MSRSPRRDSSLLRPETFALLAGFLDYLQVECGLSANTRKAYQGDLRHFLAYLDENALGDLSGLTPRHVEGSILAAGQRGMSTATIARELAAVKMFCRFLVIQRVLERDVSVSIEAPRKWHRLPTVLNDQAVKVLLEAPDEDRDCHAERDRAILAFLYATGVRAGELVNVKLPDVNFNLGVARVIGKGSKERIVPAASSAMEALQTYINGSRRKLCPGPATQTLFLSRTGRGLHREDIFRIVRKYVRRVEIRGKVGPHTLRHCFATQLLAHGADLRSVQEMLGHADISTTQVYTHVDADRLKSVHRKFHPRG